MDPLTITAVGLGATTALYSAKVAFEIIKDTKIVQNLALSFSGLLDTYFENNFISKCINRLAEDKEEQFWEPENINKYFNDFLKNNKIENSALQSKVEEGKTLLDNLMKNVECGNQLESFLKTNNIVHEMYLSKAKELFPEQLKQVDILKN
jgi:hypothetical protein